MFRIKIIFRFYAFIIIIDNKDEWKIITYEYLKKYEFGAPSRVRTADLVIKSVFAIHNFIISLSLDISSIAYRTIYFNSI